MPIVTAGNTRLRHPSDPLEGNMLNRNEKIKSMISPR